MQENNSNANTTAADNNFHNIFQDFLGKGLIFHVNCVLADTSNEISSLKEVTKFENVFCYKFRPQHKRLFVSHHYFLS